MHPFYTFGRGESQIRDEEVQIDSEIAGGFDAAAWRRVAKTLDAVLPAIHDAILAPVESHAQRVTSHSSTIILHCPPERAFCTSVLVVFIGLGKILRVHDWPQRNVRAKSEKPRLRDCAAAFPASTAGEWVPVGYIRVPMRNGLMRVVLPLVALAVSPPAILLKLKPAAGCHMTLYVISKML